MSAISQATRVPAVAGMMAAALVLARYHGLSAGVLVPLCWAGASAFAVVHGLGLAAVLGASIATSVLGAQMFGFGLGSTLILGLVGTLVGVYVGRRAMSRRALAVSVFGLSLLGLLPYVLWSGVQLTDYLGWVALSVAAVGVLAQASMTGSALVPLSASQLLLAIALPLGLGMRYSYLLFLGMGLPGAVLTSLAAIGYARARRALSAPATGRHPSVVVS